MVKFYRGETMINAYLEKMNILVVVLDERFHNGELFNIALYREQEEVELVFLEKNHKILKYEVDFVFGYTYTLKINNGFDVYVDLSKVVRTKEFDERYKYDGFLGSQYDGKTKFAVWAPTAEAVRVFLPFLDRSYAMTRSKGVYSVEVEQDLTGQRYVYVVKRNGAWYESIDPYANLNADNSKYSVVYNLEKKDVKRVDFDPVEAVIYELHVRDYTINNDVIHKGKYQGMIETKSFEYLKDLGVTHVQLMPVYDFGSVKENSDKFYNWGYDPVQLNVPEGWYATNNEDDSKITEFNLMIDHAHKVGLKVNMDMVFNHVFIMQSHAFEKIVPGYYFRYEGDQLSDGSFCGNDIESSRYMSRRFFLDTVERWVTHYGIDGFRFDLMGIHDCETMNLVRERLDSISPGIMLYGEGWNMPTLYDKPLANIQNNDLMPRIGHFNDYIRNNFKILNFHGLFEENILPLDKSVNYVECHDDETLFDLVGYEKSKLITSMLILTPGILFLHAGQEFYRTKKGIRNTYCSPDYINALDWERYSENLDYVEHIKSLIQLRKDHDFFKGFEYVVTDHELSIKKDGTEIRVVYNKNKTRKYGLDPYEYTLEVVNE
jgi:pullulanase